MELPSEVIAHGCWAARRFHFFTFSTPSCISAANSESITKQVDVLAEAGAAPEARVERGRLD